MNLKDIKIEPIIESLRLENISDEEYFSKRFSNYISNSRLGLINPKQDGSPEKFFNGSFNACSDSLILGSALHEIVLQPESFFIVDNIDRPTAKMGYLADILYKKNGHAPTEEEIIKAATKIDYYGGFLSENKILNIRSKCNNYWRMRAIFESKNSSNKIPIYLSDKQRTCIKSCLEGISRSSQIQKLLNPTGLLRQPENGFERTILLDVKVTCGEQEFILKLKSKLDQFTLDFDNNTIFVNDLKTIGQLVNEFDNAIQKYHYYRELGMYSYLLSLCAKKFYDMNNPIIKGNFLVVSTIPKYYTKVVPMTKSLFKKGFNEFSQLLKLVAYYVATDTRYRDFAAV